MTLRMFNVHQATFDLRKQNMNLNSFKTKIQILYAKIKSPTEIHKYNNSEFDFIDDHYRQSDLEWQPSPFND